jgi:hypothetical protein
MDKIGIFTSVATGQAQGTGTGTISTTRAPLNAAVARPNSRVMPQDGQMDGGHGQPGDRPDISWARCHKVIATKDLTDVPE